MAAFDFKKEYKDLYLPKSTPSVADIPEMTFIMVDGEGNPNTCAAYKNAMEILYGLSYTIKMSKIPAPSAADMIESRANRLLAKKRPNTDKQNGKTTRKTPIKPSILWP